MNVKDIAAHWVALHEALGVGQVINDEAQYTRLLAIVDSLVDQIGDEDAHRLWALIALVGDLLDMSRISRGKLQLKKHSKRIIGAV